MKKRIFITGYSLKLPGISTAEDLESALLDIASFLPEFTTIRVAGEDKVLVGNLTQNENSPYFPKRSDLKVMRQDVAAAAVCAAEVMAQSGIPAAEWTDIPLFFANGICVEKQEDEELLLQKAYHASVESNSEAEKQAAIYKTIPPLLALRTLTNSSESFVAQYTGLAGNNTTFGNTSLSGFYALKEAIGRIESGENGRVVVGSSHAAGTYSYLTFRNFTSGNSLWRESVGAAFLLLESEESCTGRGARPLAEVTAAKTILKAPSLFHSDPEAPYKAMGSVKTADHCIYSGGLSEEDYEEEKTAVKKVWPVGFSWYPKLGHLGAAAMLINVATGIHFLRNQTAVLIHCLDKDAYGRESILQLKSPQSETL